MSDNVSREALFQAQVAEASGFYKLIVSISSAFLGGSLVFLDKISMHPSSGSMYLLLIGWILLIITIAFICIVRARNLESAHQVLENNIPKAREIDSQKRVFTTISIITFILGILLIMLFGYVNISV